MLSGTANSDQNGRDSNAQQHTLTFSESVKCCSLLQSALHSLSFVRVHDVVKVLAPSARGGYYSLAERRRALNGTYTSIMAP
ncbi:hypothetical protein PPTG_24353 [Phytophthora nicotianae INRA-310]|uniref:Uncharacterized protein n=2 Tax=Phytophthora nicotianae TaxID=4792 RepID=W2PIA3_PHYN3|nr:hypothetical protein PPTG_24353 [Phytophthora nicotianae INRA-310]ETI31956.1 hypothetical protein F443_21137 [Phytophthora nicotianae P1569]ETM99958.1 hypothetical protein PPTG_24353 [Phytophthora nicotianae INRA-310]